MYNAFSVKLAAKKANFAFVSAESDSFALDDEECATIKAHRPWTCRLQDCRTDVHGLQVELLAYLAHNRDNFVLKSNDGLVRLHRAGDR